MELELKKSVYDCSRKTSTFDISEFFVSHFIQRTTRMEKHTQNQIKPDTQYQTSLKSIQ